MAKDGRMSSMDEQVLRASKEIVVKFIETGRISPTTFPEIFNSIYFTVENAVKKSDSSETTRDVSTGESHGETEP